MGYHPAIVCKPKDLKRLRKTGVQGAVSTRARTGTLRLLCMATLT
jgi:hypothetical protein